MLGGVEQNLPPRCSGEVPCPSAIPGSLSLPCGQIPSPVVSRQGVAFSPDREENSPQTENPSGLRL